MNTGRDEVTFLDTQCRAWRKRLKKMHLLLESLRRGMLVSGIELVHDKCLWDV